MERRTGLPVHRAGLLAFLSKLDDKAARRRGTGVLNVQQYCKKVKDAWDVREGSKAEGTPPHFRPTTLPHCLEDEEKLQFFGRATSARVSTIRLSIGKKSVYIIGQCGALVVTQRPSFGGICCCLVHKCVLFILHQWQIKLKPPHNLGCLVTATLDIR